MFVGTGMDAGVFMMAVMVGVAMVAVAVATAGWDVVVGIEEIGSEYFIIARVYTLEIIKNQRTTRRSRRCN